mgnify:CR=1 FL=1
MFLKTYEVCVNRDLWENRDAPEALQRLKEQLHGVVLYEHVFPVNASEIILSINDLIDAEIIESVKIATLLEH